jgi:hypothetical protein
MKIHLPPFLLLATYVVVGTNAQVNLGNPGKLQNNVPPGKLNTGRGSETAQQKADRMAGKTPIADPIDAPDPNLGPFDQPNGPYGAPVNKAKCLNEVYKPTIPDVLGLYSDYVKIFTWGFDNAMGHPIQSRSLFNNKVTNNRFPSMFLRMCFHDNSIDAAFPSFKDYVKSNIDENRNWRGPQRYLETSGADASVLICPEERYHPNENYDQTASRVLYALQSAETGITSVGVANAISLLDKYALSYADLLHNGCVAATLYLTQSATDSKTLSTLFKFGRKDACHLPGAGKKRMELCGPTELLPGVLMEADELNNWFSERGMNACTWLALMWTHTVMVRRMFHRLGSFLLWSTHSLVIFNAFHNAALQDNMMMTCPLLKLPGVPQVEDMNELDQYRNTGRIYFHPGDKLDYFDFFLNRGTHVPTPPGQVIDLERENCMWKLDNGERYHWPMTRPDCALGRDAVEARALAQGIDLGALKNTIEWYKGQSTDIKAKALLYALGMLSSGDGSVAAGPTTDGAGCAFPAIEALNAKQKFGAFWE